MIRRKNPVFSSFYLCIHILPCYLSTVLYIYHWPEPLSFHHKNIYKVYFRLQGNKFLPHSDKIIPFVQVHLNNRRYHFQSAFRCLFVRFWHHINHILQNIHHLFFHYILSIWCNKQCFPLLHQNHLLVPQSLLSVFHQNNKEFHYTILQIFCYI